ncbi:unnamed protein product [Pleuronectes platessa]|uniref:Uncharacterized protein n=1 Tax=Pleuronectes platessa TaxID=8262 RepID=A0A9N7V6T1_PLEPL|nr:unnamed protein product [Pleuronectes platessa]
MQEGRRAVRRPGYLRHAVSNVAYNLCQRRELGAGEETENKKKPPLRLGFRINRSQASGWGSSAPGAHVHPDPAACRGPGTARRANKLHELMMERRKLREAYNNHGTERYETLGLPCLRSPYNTD